MIKYFGLTLDRRQNLSKTRKPITILLLFRLDYSIVKFVQSSFTRVRISITSRFINLLRSTETAVASLYSQPGSRLVVNEAWANPNLQTQMESWKLLAGSRLAIKIDNPWGLWREVKRRRYFLALENGIFYYQSAAEEIKKCENEMKQNKPSEGEKVRRWKEELKILPLFTTLADPSADRQTVKRSLLSFLGHEWKNKKRKEKIVPPRKSLSYTDERFAFSRRETLCALLPLISFPPLTVNQRVKSN